MIRAPSHRPRSWSPDRARRTHRGNGTARRARASMIPGADAAGNSAQNARIRENSLAPPSMKSWSAPSSPNEGRAPDSVTQDRAQRRARTEPLCGLPAIARHPPFAPMDSGFLGTHRSAGKPRQAASPGIHPPAGWGCHTSTLPAGWKPQRQCSQGPAFRRMAGARVSYNVRVCCWTDDRLFYAVAAPRSAVGALGDSRIELDRIPFSECGSTSSRSLKDWTE